MTEALADTLAVGEVIVRFATAMDQRDWPLLSGCFAEEVDADLTEASGHPPSKLKNDEFVGAMRGLLERPALRTQHLISNQAVVLAGETANCRSYYVANHFNTESKQRFTVHGWYLDTLARGAGGWVITGRKIVVAWAEGTPSILGL